MKCIVCAVSDEFDNSSTVLSGDTCASSRGDGGAFLLWKLSNRYFLVLILSLHFIMTFLPIQKYSIFIIRPDQECALVTAIPFLI